MADKFQNMYLWLLYLLPVTSNASPDQRPSSVILKRTWWSPIEPNADINGFSVVEGDILRPHFEGFYRNAIKSKKYLWENGVIPYVLGNDFKDEDKRKIKESMELIQSNTCVKFVERKNERDYIKFQNKNGGCYSTVGRYTGPRGARPVNLQTPWCTEVRGLIDHELLHVAGLFHEQSRADRDNYVTIHWNNMDSRHKDDFLKGNDRLMTSFGVPYDYDSIMHYGNKDFSINGKPTITAKENPSKILGQRKAPTEHDFEKIRKLYNCN